MSLFTALRRRLLAIPARELEMGALGATIDAAQRPALQAILDSAVTGYDVTLADDSLADLTPRVAAAVDPACVGFAHEGAAMALSLLDAIRDRGRVARFFESCAGRYDFFVPLGVGFALARLPWVRGGIEARAERFGDVYDGLVINGYAFHQAFFRARGVLEKTPRPPGLSPLATRCFDHGIGRALWFMSGGHPQRIADTVLRFDVGHREDLWAGVGTACAFAGRAHADATDYARVLAQLAADVGPHRAGFEIGVVLAAQLVRRTRHPHPWVAQATRAILDLGDDQASDLAERAWARAERGGPRFTGYASFASEITRELGSRPAG